MDGAWEQPMPPTMRAMSLPPDNRATAMGGAGLHELIERLAAHLRAHLQEVLANRRRYFKKHVDIPPALDQSGPVAAGNEIDLVGGKSVLRHVGLLIGAEALAIGRIGQ